MKQEKKKYNNHNYHLKVFKWILFVFVFILTSSVYAVDYYIEENNIDNKKIQHFVPNNQDKMSEDFINKIQSILKEKNKEEVLKENNKVLIANLQDKTLTLKDGANIYNYDLATIGPVGKFYETPAGEYNIKTKEKIHYSSLGHVYMPYSMQFFGNFFIHGIPYYEDGSEVSTEYSGGCIRVETKIMEDIYNKLEIGDKIVIINPDKYSNNIESDILIKAKNMDSIKAENLFLSLIALEIANVNNITTLQTGETTQVLNMLSDIINNNNLVYKSDLLSRMYYNNNIKYQRLYSISDDFDHIDYNNKYQESYYYDNIWKSDKNKIILLNYIKNHKSYLYNLIQW